ncbi:MAG: SDR family NAD(P)-dependent oxidoreductase [Gammaproteobacteria bacterium]
MTAQSDAAGPDRQLAVVVGAAGNMGSALCRALQAAGLGVVAVGRSQAALASLAESLPGLVTCAADISRDESIAQIGACLDAPVRMALNCAGVPVAGGILDAPTTALEAAVAIKITGMLRLVRAVDGWLRAGSRLVAVGGHYGFEPVAYHATAGVANAALPNLVRQLSLAYGERGITAHVIAPGPADTARLHGIARERAARRGVPVDTILDEMRAESSLRTFTTLEQVTWAVTMLLAPEASAMTGSTLMLDAGRRKGLP